ncbi:MAG: nucleoside monophosphate kinase [Candidatus Bathyarchaeota archaeon]|nr:nucleoside monophosphate kinase [Candidatus Bathyarchaeota archaeon]
MNAIIFGAPGSGKGTYSALLKNKLNLNVISMGDIFRELMKEDTSLGKTVKSYVRAGLLVPDEITLDILKQQIAKIPKGYGFILDGFPRNLAQAQALESIAKIDVILQLVVPDWIIIERVSGRRLCRNCGAVYNLQFLKPKVDGVCDKCGGQLYQRPDDNAEVIKIRLELYECETSSLISYFKTRHVPIIIHTSDRLQIPPETVVDYFVAELKKLHLV